MKTITRLINEMTDESLTDTEKNGIMSDLEDVLIKLGNDRNDPVSISKKLAFDINGYEELKKLVPNTSEAQRIGNLISTKAKDIGDNKEFNSKIMDEIRSLIFKSTQPAKNINPYTDHSMKLTKANTRGGKLS